MSGHINPAFIEDLKESKQHLQIKTPISQDTAPSADSCLIQKTKNPSNGTLSKDSIEIEMNNSEAPQTSGMSYQRRASVADIAIAFATSSMTPGSSMEKIPKGKLSLDYWRRSYRFSHPFGHTTSILDEILGSHHTDDGERTTSSSPAKLLVWVIFACFLVGMAGAIILGAGMFWLFSSDLYNKFVRIFGYAR